MSLALIIGVGCFLVAGVVLVYIIIQAIGDTYYNTQVNVYNLDSQNREHRAIVWKTFDVLPPASPETYAALPLAPDDTEVDGVLLPPPH